MSIGPMGRAFDSRGLDDLAGSRPRNSEETAIGGEPEIPALPFPHVVDRVVEPLLTLFVEHFEHPAPGIEDP